MDFKKKKSIVLEIKDNVIDIIVGNTSKIDFEDTINIKEGICDDGYIRNVPELANILSRYFSEKDISEKIISFVVFGSDIIIRNIELPYTRGKELEKNIKFEADEVIANREHYYVDYEIIKEVKDDDGKKKSYEILLVGCTKQKIDLLVELSEALGKKLDTIDVLTNTLNKVMVNGNIDYTGKNVGLIYFGYDFSNISISKDVLLKMERTIPFGFENIVREMKHAIELEKNKECSYEEVKKEIERKIVDIESFFDEYPRIKEIFTQFLELIYKTMQFYNAGKNDNRIDSLVLISKMEISESIIEYIEKYLNLDVKYIRGHKDLGIKIKSKDDEVFKYLSLYGLFLRR